MGEDLLLRFFQFTTIFIIQNINWYYQSNHFIPLSYGENNNSHKNHPRTIKEQLKSFISYFIVILYHILNNALQYTSKQRKKTTILQNTTSIQLKLFHFTSTQLLHQFIISSINNHVFIPLKTIRKCYHCTETFIQIIHYLNH